jgi:hypothetical protein
MRRVVLIALFVIGWGASPARAAVALVSGQIAFDDSQPFITDGTGEATLTAPCTPGNTLVVAIGTTADRTINSVADDGGNTYSSGGGTAAEAHLWFAPCTNAASLITVTLSAATTDQGLVLVAEFSGLNNSDLLEDPEEFVDTASPYDSGNVVTTVDDSLLFGFVISDSAANYTNEAGWTDALDSNFLVAYKILSATATEAWNPTSAASENSAAVLGAFNGAAVGGAAPCQRTLTTLGVGRACP